MARASKFSPEVRERAVRVVVEHAEQHESEWAAIRSIAAKLGCAAENRVLVAHNPYAAIKLPREIWSDYRSSSMRATQWCGPMAGRQPVPRID